MRFRMYEIKVTQNGAINRLSDLMKPNQMAEVLRKLPFLKDNNDEVLKYTAMYSTYKDSIVLSTLIQEYNIKLIKFAQNIKEEQELPPDRTNENTYFFIDVKESKLYIQNKRYPVDSNLNSNKTLERLQVILFSILEENSVDIQLLPITINYTIEDFENFFKESIVKYIKAANLEGLEIPEGSVLHNPREDLDGPLAESWNCYSKDTIDLIEIQAKKDKKLNKNPLAKIAMILAKNNKDKEIVKKMEIIDAGQITEIKPKGNSYKVIPINSSQQKDHTNVYDKIIENIIKK